MVGGESPFRQYSREAYVDIPTQAPNDGNWSLLLHRLGYFQRSRWLVDTDIVLGIWLRHCLNGRQAEFSLIWPSIWTSLPEIVRNVPQDDHSNLDTKKRL